MNDEEIQLEIDKCNAELAAIHAKINVLLAEKGKFRDSRLTKTEVTTALAEAEAIAIK